MLQEIGIFGFYKLHNNIIGKSLQISFFFKGFGGLMHDLKRYKTKFYGCKHDELSAPLWYNNEASTSLQSGWCKLESSVQCQNNLTPGKVFAWRLYTFTNLTITLPF